MRIAFFCPHSDPLAVTGEPDAGGQCIYEARVAEQLARQGHEVRVYTRRWGGKAVRQDICDGATIFRYPMGPDGFLRKEDMGPHLAEFVEHTLFRQTTWLRHADAIHGHYWDGGASALMASLALGKPLLFTSHSLGLLKRDRVPDPTPDGSKFRYDVRIRAEKKILDAADAVIALSRTERDALTGRYGASAEKVRIVPGGVDTEVFHLCLEKTKLQRQLGFSSDYLLFTVGRLDPRKGFLELIEAIPQVVKTLRDAGKTVTFLIPIGPENPSADESAYRDALLGRANELRITDAIHWFHRLTDQELFQYYAAADLFLCPSPYEPFGLVLVEAFASGTPVIATPHGGPTDIVTPGVNGYLADPADPPAFAARILDALLAPENERRRMRAAAAERARTRYAWPSVASAIADVYRSIRDDAHALR
ncbi:glycosyltransferase [Methylocaldum sp. RMAD-M]|jgi:D-inositol-3-phosphate glycosyltransferase|uniref:glycosyltransferase n=1 Tax=Methylocaldum sp. RMAD-M TaxID=2806557 RepID=UPI00143D19AD|nr:glycosyltransferase [Methylocaldum sp. RMAD-M]MBP1149987.1 glycosyltransferase involved in cell wall biosynthesis [Methylocaldum sp. RMAD-M]